MSEIKRYYYEAGSTAHKIETMPAHEERERNRREAEKLRRSQRRHENARILRLKRYKMMKMLVFLAVISTFFTGVIYLQNGITTSMRSISSLEEQISDLKAENSATESRIAATANLNSVRKKAKKLGMKYADSKQIKYYELDDEDYMSQYTDLSQ